MPPARASPDAAAPSRGAPATGARPSGRGPGAASCSGLVPDARLPIARRARGVQASRAAPARAARVAGGPRPPSGRAAEDRVGGGSARSDGSAGAGGLGRGARGSAAAGRRDARGSAAVGGAVPFGSSVWSRRCASVRAASHGSGGGPSDPLHWEELVTPPGTEALGRRAGSASDAGVLRRKGHLKEQDSLINLMQEMHRLHSSVEVMQKMEGWAEEHRRRPRQSRLKRLVPSLGRFFTPLPLTSAFWEYDEFFALSRRQHVPPNFAELRHILNIAQIHASSRGLRLITFDADGTLYADGAHIEHDAEAIAHILELMTRGVHVAIVTAAGYPGQPERFEARVAGLLAAFEARQVPERVTDRFHIVGGECNYLLKVVWTDQGGSEEGGREDAGGEMGEKRGGEGGEGAGEENGEGKDEKKDEVGRKRVGEGEEGAGAEGSGGRSPSGASVLPAPRSRRCRLAFVPDADWLSPVLLALEEPDVEALLDRAQESLLRHAARLRLDVSVTRKARAVGVTPKSQTIYEVLEDLALAVRADLDAAEDRRVPYCCFNGGADVFVDVGNKSLGLDALSRYLGVRPESMLHVGDRFSASGNDFATRDCCAIVWVANPEETDFFITMLLADIDEANNKGDKEERRERRTERDQTNDG